uniref:hypothetical protein n=1 Tax=Nocardia neocaledoniensis TaxID=236511 RepID=UPI002455136A
AFVLIVVAEKSGTPAGIGNRIDQAPRAPPPPPAGGFYTPPPRGPGAGGGGAPPPRHRFTPG